MKSNKNRRPLKRRIIKPKFDYFEKNKIIPDYKDVENIRKFVSERGKIVGRMYTGISQKNQKLLGKAVKRARFLALLPFKVLATA